MSSIGKTPPAEQPAFGLTAKLATFAGVLALAILALVARLWILQLSHGATYERDALANQVRTIPAIAPRGRIFDRRGRVLVRSRPSYVCALVPSQIHDIDATLRTISQLTGVPIAALRQRLLHHRGVNYTSFDDVAANEPYGPIVIARDLSTQQIAAIAEQQSTLPGVAIQSEPVRDYPYHEEASHVFGYVGLISEDEYERRKREGYSPNDVVGKDGIEAVYDRYLRGTPGGERIQVDAEGRLVRDLGPTEPVPGDSLFLAIDWRIQSLAERALAAQRKAWGGGRGRRIAGAVVVLDPNSGGVLALASQPNFDPNDFASGISSKRYAHYLDDKLLPLYDRAIGAATETGSTFKLVTGSAAITERVITPPYVLYDPGYFNCYGQEFRDIVSGGLGETNFDRALAASSDGYFYQLGYRLGNARLRKYALLFGLGRRTHIDLPGEYSGNWPTDAWMMKTYGVPLEKSDACQLAIGQGAMEATPLQMASVVAAVANGGTLYRPHIVNEIRDPSGKLVASFDRRVIRQIPVTQEALAQVRLGMSHVTSAGGTAYGLAVPGVPFGGKTGTVETDGGQGPNTTWFVAFAPLVHPKLAIAVYMERTGGYGANVAAPIARDIIAGMLAPKPTPAPGASPAKKR